MSPGDISRTVWGVARRGRMAARRNQLRPPRTQPDIAAIAGVTLRQVKRWEAGTSNPYRRHREGIAKAYDWPLDRLDELLAKDELDDLSALPAAAGRLVTGPTLAEMDRDRRELLAGLGAMLVSPAPAPPDGRELLIGFLVDRLARYKAAEAAHGVSVVVDAVQSDLRLMRRAAALSDALVWSTVGYASFAGWLCSDAGHDAAALRHRQTALTAARHTGDRNLIAYSLVGLALGRCDAGDGPGARRLTAEAAEVDPPAPAVARYLARVTADAASLTSDRDRVERALDQVATLGDAPADDRYPWLEQNRLSPGYLKVRRATCYGNLGLFEDAAELWQQALADHPATLARDRGVYAARYAGVLAAIGEQDRAAAAVAEATDALDATGSVRLRRELLAAAG
jgi:tetratricopeptide (TPR) repeat protein